MGRPIYSFVAAAAAESAGLRAALATRLVIGQAEGLLMARYKLDGDAAFALLVKLSQETHIKLRDVAARLVADATQQTTTVDSAVSRNSTALKSWSMKRFTASGYAVGATVPLGDLASRLRT